LTLIAPSGRGLSLIARSVSRALGVGDYREGVGGTCHLEILIPLILIENIVNLLPTEPLQLAELPDGALLQSLVIDVSLAVGVVGEERSIVVLLLVGLQLVLPLLVKPIEADDLLGVQIKLFLKLRVVERVEPLILHLDLTESFALQRALEKLVSLLGKLLIELVAELGKSLVPFFVGQIGRQLVLSLLVLLHQLGILLANLRKLVAIEAHLLP
jgi:hypothetical protein